MTKQNKFIEEEEVYTSNILEACRKINDIAPKYKDIAFPCLEKIQYLGGNKYVLHFVRKNDTNTKIKVIDSTMLSHLLTEYISNESLYDCSAENFLVQIIAEIEDDYR